MKRTTQILEGWGLPYGENCMILVSTVFVWSTRLTDGRAIAYIAR